MKEKFDLPVDLDTKSDDQQSHWDSCSMDDECIYKMSCQAIKSNLQVYRTQLVLHFTILLTFKMPLDMVSEAGGNSSALLNF